jgi:hypothetical protein
MKTYQMVWISDLHTSNFSLGSSDISLIKRFLSDLKQMVPNYQIIASCKDFDGNIYSCSVNNLDGKQMEIKYWLFQQLLKTGWEPFSVTTRMHVDGEIYLRHEIMDKQEME